MKKQFFIGLFCCWLILLSPPQASAETMQNNNYTLEKQEAEIKPFIQSASKPSTKQTELKPIFSGKNYTASAAQSSYLSFAISEDTINFGKLTATNPVIRLFGLKVSSSEKYQIFTAENHPLLDDKNIIPDTTCDSGMCTEITSAPWTSALTYGFGFHTSDMPENDYKQLPDLSKKEYFEAVLGNKITYKVNVSNTQSEGAYKNVVTYLATPTF